MRLYRNKKQLEKLFAINELLFECHNRIEKAKFNLNQQYTLDDRDKFLYYSEIVFKNDIRRYENLYLYLEKKYNLNVEKL